MSDWQPNTPKPTPTSHPTWEVPGTIAPPHRTYGVRLIAGERQRQIMQEGWTPDHDDHHDSAELALAACGYITVALTDEYEVPHNWPWDASWWKPSEDPIRNLTKAGALIAAEIDRLRRIENGRGSDAESRLTQGGTPCPTCGGVAGYIERVNEGNGNVGEYPCSTCRTPLSCPFVGATDPNEVTLAADCADDGFDDATEPPDQMRPHEQSLTTTGGIPAASPQVTGEKA